MGVASQMIGRRRRRRAALLMGSAAALAFAVGCRNAGDPAGPETAPNGGDTGTPGGTGRPPGWGAPPPSPPPPPLVGRKSVFNERAPYYGTDRASRIVLYSDSIVVLQIFSNEYRGIVRGRASALTYDFGNPRLPWIAFGSRRGDTLSIDYDAVMGAADFVSGEYILAPGR